MEALMSRVQLALNVSNLDQSIEFYSKFFKTPPAKVRPGYANFAIEQPPLKLVLIENADHAGSLNHLGVEVFSTDEVSDAAVYLAGVGLTTRGEDETTCCYAVQDKVWVDGADNVPWEVYAVLADSPTANGAAGDNRCCVLDAPASPEGSAVASCC
jgi:catechol 2,3-dioxygenase-like lactoylglutathione lyase family enzyme